MQAKGSLSDLHSMSLQVLSANTSPAPEWNLDKYDGFIRFYTITEKGSVGFKDSGDNE